MTGLVTFLAAFGASWVGTWLLLRLSPRGGFIDVPNERSSHEAPKPRFGGVAIMFAFVAVMTVVLARRADATLWPLMVGGLLIFVTGVLDDRRGLPVAWRFGAQIVATGLVLASGHVVHHMTLPFAGTISLGPLAWPFTALFVLASINFYNFIDGIDGLAAGGAFIAGAFLSLIAFMLGHSTLALACLAISGSAAGFLQFNFPPSRLFMGDSGSTFLGFFFAYVAVAGNQLQPSLPLFVPVMILSSLYLDAGLTVIRRALRGEKILQAHRTHYYQRLLSLGLNHKQVTFIEYALTVLLGVSAVIYFRAGGFFPAFVMLCWALIFTMAILKVRSLERGDRMFWERRSVLVIAGDLAMIAIAYFGAFFLRVNLGFTDEQWHAVLRAFPIVFVVRSACFFWYGLYRGVWKYTSTVDVLRIVKAVATGSAIILALVVFFYRFVAFPRSLFMIEFVLLIVMLGGSRFASRLFHEFGKDALGANPRRVAVIGAGDRGEHVGREIRDTRGKTASVVCYIDDDKDKLGLVLRGVPIVGPIDELSDICRRFDVDELVLGISNLPADRLRSVVSAARDAGVPLDADPDEALVGLDRVARGLGRKMPAGPREDARRYFPGKRVLITNGGQSVGPALAAELHSAGADVTVQVGSTGDSGRFERITGDRFRVFASPFEREIDAARVLDAAAPDVVFHCVSLATGGVVNAEDYLWRSVTRGMAALVKVAPRHAIESMVTVVFGEEDAGDSVAVRIGAAGQIIALNSRDLLAVSPKVLRFPRVLTGADLTAMINGFAGQSYRLLEHEAVSMCLEAAATYKGRVILVPKELRSMSAKQIVAAYRGRTPAAAAESVDHGLLYPGEETKPSLVEGAREVVGPVSPASEAAFEAAMRCARAASEHEAREARDDTWTALTRQPSLSEPAPDGQRRIF